mmetsp:Transcript_68224/g.163721  ORF Transcript_68224/g.163721 Transcript_68224/m.163721 type:complete len:212 (-) Transcript_68224:337-972(-)
MLLPSKLGQCCLEISRLLLLQAAVWHASLNVLTGKNIVRTKLLIAQATPLLEVLVSHVRLVPLLFRDREMHFAGCHSSRAWQKLAIPCANATSCMAHRDEVDERISDRRWVSHPAGKMQEIVAAFKPTLVQVGHQVTLSQVCRQVVNHDCRHAKLLNLRWSQSAICSAIAVMHRDSSHIIVVTATTGLLHVHNIRVLLHVLATSIYLMTAR